MDTIERVEKRKCLIVGAGTYGQVYAHYLSEEYDLIGFADDDMSLHGSSVFGTTVLGDVGHCADTLSREVCVFVPIGNNRVRVRLMDYFSAKGFDLPSFIHSSASVHSSVTIGRGVYVLPNSFVMPEAVLSDSVMVSMGVNIAHHTVASKGCFFSQGSNIGASVFIGEKAYFGIGSTLMTGVRQVGTGSTIGAGAVVIRDVPDYAVTVGNPARIIRYDHQNHE